MAKITHEHIISAIKDPRLIWYYCMGWGIFYLDRFLQLKLQTPILRSWIKKRIDKKREQCIKLYDVDCQQLGQCEACGCEFLPLAISGKPCKKKNNVEDR